jgi:hypothetical protein
MENHRLFGGQLQVKGVEFNYSAGNPMIKNRFIELFAI